LSFGFIFVKVNRYTSNQDQNDHRPILQSTDIVEFV